ncbi:hypothetical protein QMG90_07670 [Trabulsiella odontotermitis]|uniref:hypothetical protein n=1 Tax=Trabulsiella odontotermitis TaxID=379893 RepID=UPI0024B81EEC|nr:hypothetical protein [Trabulsiella odontotermitis]WHP32770.1 hypothetical protein QMG90_07670 [Trabulsiella odontotermitis]
MYSFERTPCPDYLAECWEALGAQFDTAKQQNPAYQFYWYAAFRYEDTRKLLNQMTAGHCAFCDGGDLGALSRETIEHFRPKSRSEFRRIAFQWENLYPCCDQCQSVKREDFDDRLLVADAQGYRFEDYFIVDYQTGEIQPNPLASADNQDRAALTLDFYGLNIAVRKHCRKKELKRYHQRDPEEDVIDDFSYRYFLMDA